MSYMNVMMLVNMAADYFLSRKSATCIWKIVMLAIMAGTMTSVAICAVLYTLYLGLVAYHVPELTAAMAVTGVTVLISLLFVGLAVRWLNRRRPAPGAPILREAEKMAQAFINGFSSAGKGG